MENEEERARDGVFAIESLDWVFVIWNPDTIPTSDKKAFIVSPSHAKDSMYKIVTWVPRDVAEDWWKFAPSRKTHQKYLQMELERKEREEESVLRLLNSMKEQNG